MIGNPVDYDKKFKDTFPTLQPTFDADLKEYLSLVPGKNVLDLGIGQGKNSIPLSELGFNVTGVDYSTKCLDICKANCSKLDLVKSDIRLFDIEKNKYDLILSSCVLHFLHKDDSYKIMHSMKDNINQYGLVYVSVFSTQDPKFNKVSSSEHFDVLDNNVFHNKINDTYLSFFTKEEILDIFSGFTTIFVSDKYSLDLDHGEPHYHGLIKYIGRKEKFLDK